MFKVTLKFIQMKYLFTSIFLFTGFFVLAQNNYLGKTDPAAKKIMDKVSNKYKSYKTLSADFALKVYNTQGELQGSQTGTLSMKGKKYMILMGSQEVYNDGSTVYSYDRDTREVQLTRFDPADPTITPQSIFTNFYDKDFLYKLNDESQKNGKTIQEIEFTPLDKTLTYFKVQISVDKQSNQIVSARIFEKNGNRYIYTLSNYKINTDIPDASFAFSAAKHPNVEVVDLR